MLVFRRIHLGPQLVGRRPQHRLEVPGCGLLLASASSIPCRGGSCRSFTAAASFDALGQADGAASPPPLADQAQAQEALLDRFVLLFADLAIRCPAQRLPCGLVADGAAVSGEHLQQQVAQVVVAGFWCAESGGVGHRIVLLNPILPCGTWFCAPMQFLHRLPTVCRDATWAWCRKMWPGSSRPVDTLPVLGLILRRKAVQPAVLGTTQPLGPKGLPKALQRRAAHST